MSLEIKEKHECDECDSEMGRNDQCLCSSCLDEFRDKAYNEGYETAKKEYEIPEPPPDNIK